jgi:seryl-tRNA synthetase
VTSPVDTVWGQTVAPGVVIWDAGFERLSEALIRALTRLGRDMSEETVFLPPVIDRAVLERGGYYRSFPDLLGSVTVFSGDDRDHARIISADEPAAAWAVRSEVSDVVLAPAACYFVYPELTGVLGCEEVERSVLGCCYRHEPSADPMRLRSFRMYERVVVGTPAVVDQHTRAWLELAEGLLRSLDLSVRPAVSTDAFFGRAGRISADYQKRAKLKTELRWAAASRRPPVALASVNRHEEHFGVAFNIRTPEGHHAVSGCAAFGIERVCLALVHQHGREADSWPRAVRARLGV